MSFEAWETLIFMKVYVEWMRKLKSYGGGFPALFCTNYPIYLARYQAFKGDYTAYMGAGSIQTFIDYSDSGEQTDFIKMYYKLIKASGSRGVDFMSFKYHGNTRRNTISADLCLYLAWRFNSFSGIKMGAFTTSVTNNILDSGGQIRAILIRQKARNIAIDTLTGRQMSDISINQAIARTYMSDSVRQSTAKDISSILPLNDKTKRDPLNRNWSKCMVGPIMGWETFQALQLGPSDTDTQRDPPHPSLPSNARRSSRDSPSLLAKTQSANECTYFTASDAIILDESIQKNVVQVSPPGSPLDIILGLLNTGALVFNRHLTASEFLDIDESDELYQWLWTILGSPTTSQLKLAANPEHGHIGEFRLSLMFKQVLKDKSKVSESPFFSSVVTFSSAFNDSGFIEKPPNLSGSTSSMVNKLFEPARAFLLSLNTESLPDLGTLTFSQLLEMFSIDAGQWAKFFLNAVDLTLDTQHGARNAFWIFVDGAYATTLRLQLKAKTSLAEAFKEAALGILSEQTLGNAVQSIDIKDSPKIIVKKQWNREGFDPNIFDHKSDSQLAVSARLSLKNKSGSDLGLVMDTVLVLNEEESSWYLIFGGETEGLSFEDMKNFVVGFFENIDFPEIDKYLPEAKNLILRRIRFVSRKDGDPFVTMDLQISWATMIFFVSLTFGQRFQFSGQLFPENRPDQLGEGMSFAPYMPNHEIWTNIVVKPKDGFKAGEVGDLGIIYRHMTGKNDQFPTGPLDQKLRLIGLSFGYSSDRLYFDAIIMFPKPDQSQAVVPSFHLEAGKLDLNYNIKTRGIGFGVTTQMTLRDPHSESDAYIAVSLRYEKSFWILAGSITGLNGRMLYSLFDDDCNYQVANVLKSISLNLAITYTYGSGGNGSKFEVQGTLFLGDLALELIYKHNGKKANGRPDWTFQAHLSAESSPTDLVSIFRSMCGSEVAFLPDCLGSVQLSPDVSKKDIVSLEITRNTDGWLICSVDVRISTSLSFTFLQAQGKKVVGPNNKEQVPDPIRVFTLKVDDLPKVPKVPLIGDIPQPADEIDLVWIDTGKSSEGIKKSDVAVINAALVSNKSSLKYKEPVSKGSQPSAVVLANGCHFIVSNQSKVIYDCLAQTKKKQRSGLSASQQDDDSKSPTTTPMQKKLGPLVISGFRMNFARSEGSEVLSIGLDATLTLGPLAIAVEDFKLTFSIKNLSKLTDVKPEASIGGLGASFDRAPITLGGRFKHIKTKDADAYEGAAALGFMPYLFQAAGYYGESKTENGSFQSFFIYFILNGPLATVGWAEISGVTGGFGYHVDMKFPTVENVLQFPLMSPVKGEPSSAIGQFVGGKWFYPKHGSFWVAAGLSVYAFQMLSISLVAAVQWNPDIKIGLFGIATALIPKGVSEKLVFAKVQLGIVATLDVKAGVLAVDGQLTPASFVLSPNCHLTGGFAMYSWFGAANGDHKDDWVFTIGGFHQSFNKPPHYPSPPRLGISWQFDKSISITGEAYFAITPKVCMGGGRLHVTLSLGPLFAFFDASADFLINYKPFRFFANGNLSVGVKYTLDFWLATVNIDIELGAMLHLEGPPMSGYVHVDFWVFGFDVKFGSTDDQGKDPLNLDEFYNLVLESSSSTKPALSHTFLGIQQSRKEAVTNSVPHVYSCVTGLIPSNSPETTPSSQPWLVDSTKFSFSISSKFAVKTASVYTYKDGDPNPVGSKQVTENVTEEKIYAKPMQLKEQISTSDLTIKITRQKPPAFQATIEEDLIPVWKEVKGILQSVPKGLWGICKSFYKVSPFLSAKSISDDEKQDPMVGGEDKQLGDLLTGDNASLALMLGVTLTAPRGTECTEDKICEFNVRDAMGATAQEAKFPEKTWSNIDWKPSDPKDEGQYDAVTSSWKSPLLGKDAASKVLAAWSSKLGWKDSALETAIPGRLLDALDELYLEPPQISVA